MLFKSKIKDKVIFSTVSPMNTLPRALNKSRMAVIIDKSFLKKKELESCEFILSLKFRFIYFIVQLDVKNLTGVRIQLFYFGPDAIHITNFDEDQNLLKFPIKAAIFNINDFSIYIHDTVIKGAVDQIEKENTVESFFSNSDKEPRKRRREDSEEIDEQAFSVSSEYKRKVIYDSDDESILQITSSASYSSGDNQKHISDEMLQDPVTGSTSFVVPDVEPIIPSKLDEAILRKMELEDFEKKLQHLFNGPPISVKQEMIQISHINCSRKTNTDEEGVNRVIANLKLNNPIENDAITVTTRDQEYEVISGSVRVAALRSYQVNRVTVNKINQSDSNMFMIRKFIKENTAKEPDFLETTQFYKMVFSVLETTADSLGNWREKDIKTLFSPYIGLNTKLGLVLLISLKPHLCNMLEKLEASKFTLGARILRDLYAKFKMNSAETIETICKRIDGTLDDDNMRKEAARNWSIRNTPHKKLVFGKFCSGSSSDQILHLPKRFSVIKNNNCTSSYICTSIFASVAGRILPSSEVSLFYEEKGFPFSDIYNLEELSMIVKSNDSVYIETGNYINNGIIAHLVRDAQSIIVPSSEAQISMQATLRKLKNCSK